MEPNISELVLGIRKHRGWLASVYEVFGKTVGDKCEAYHDALTEGELLARKFYYEVETPKVRKEMKEWLAEPEMVAFAKDCQERRWQELSDLVEKAKKKLLEKMEHRGGVEEKKKMLSDIKTLEKVLTSDISNESIERAREYPIKNLIKVERDMAVCIEHDDKNPSMNCKNNFVYCHSCGYHADAIGVYMKLNNCNFKEVVNKLSL